jgi:hypothetical protein
MHFIFVQNGNLHLMWQALLFFGYKMMLIWSCGQKHRGVTFLAPGSVTRFGEITPFGHKKISYFLV